AKDTKDLVKPHVEDVANKLAKVEQAMNDARAALQRSQRKTAAQLQDQAFKALEEVKGDLDKLIAAAEAQKNDPLAAPTKSALDQANKAMNQAAKDLKSQKADQAVPKQDQALAALKKAKQELAAKIAELEKRKDDIAKLEEAAKKLAELTKAEKDIAAQAKEM